jgi:hypothetical protein
MTGLALAAPTLADRARRSRLRSDGSSSASSASAGAMPLETALRLERAFGVDLGGVRVHTDAAATRAAVDLSARAFTLGSDIYLGPGQRATDMPLMAHEAAHVIQQSGRGSVAARSPAPLTSAPPGPASAVETEAAAASRAATSRQSFAVTGHATAGQPQLEEESEGFIARTVWGLLDEFAPNLVPIIRRGPEGVYEWVKERVSGAVQSLVDTVMAPVRTIAGAGRFLHTHFAPLITWMQEAAARIAQNDCGPITEAAQKIEDMAARVITPVVEKIQDIAGRVGSFFQGLWDKFGAPVWDFIKQYAGRQWDQLKQLGEWIWDKTAPVRRLASRAWTWLKNKIGIGEGPEGQNGILQWIQGKARAAWDWVQAKLAPYKRQITTALTVIGGIAVMISPAGPIILAGAAIYGVIQGVRWIRANMAGGNAIVRARAYAQTVMIPQIMAAINRMTTAVTRMASSVSGKLGEFSNTIGGLVGAAASTALQFLVDGAQWLAEKAIELAAWATEKLTVLARWIGTGLQRLIAFLQPILDFLGRVGRLLIDIYGLPLLIAGSLWNRIPRCIRDPFVDWIIPLILRQIDIFKELVRDNEAWQKTKSDVMNIIRLVFVNKDLLGAIRATFHLILRVFNVPIELLQQVVAKAAVAWDVVIAAPIKFLKNAVKTVGRGLQIYWSKLKENLLYGLEGWLFGELAEKGITRPNSWTDPWDLAQFVASILGLSMAHIFDLLETRINPATVAKLRVWWARLSRAWEWIMEQRGKKPAEVTSGIIEGAKDFAKTILEGIVIWIVERVSLELATMAAAAAASAGLSEVLDAVRRVYRAIKTAVRWMRTILEMVNTTLDSVLIIAAGTLEPAANLLANAMKRATPAVIGFLGDQVGLSGVGEKLREIIDKLRAKVDRAILVIIDRIKALFEAIAQGVREAVGALLEWWKRKIRLRGGDGHAHELSFAGERRSAILMVSTTPRTVASLVDSVAEGPSGRQSPASGHISSARSQLATIDTERARPEADQAAAATNIDRAMTSIAAPVEGLLGALPDSGGLDREGPLPSLEARAAAIAAMQAISAKGAVGIDVVGQLSDEKFDQYKSEYVNPYAPAKTVGANFQWPHRYLRLRAARRQGYDAEARWKPIVFPGAGRETFNVTRADGSQVVVIPDATTASVVGDIKNWQSLSYTRQLQDFALVANPTNAREVRSSERVTVLRKLEVVVRHSTHRQGRSDVSGPLQTAVHDVGAGGGAIHYAITDLDEQIKEFSEKKNWPRS